MSDVESPVRPIMLEQEGDAEKAMQRKKMAEKKASKSPKLKSVPKVSEHRGSKPKNAVQAPSKRTASKKPISTSSKTSSKKSKKGILATVEKPVEEKKVTVKVLSTKKKPVKKKPAVRRTRKPVLPPIDVRGHIHVPQHEKLGEKEKQELLDRLQVTIRELPRIVLADPGIKHLDPKVGEVIKITRESYTAGIAVYYRVVVDV